MSRATSPGHTKRDRTCGSRGNNSIIKGPTCGSTSHKGPKGNSNISHRDRNQDFRVNREGRNLICGSTGLKGANLSENSKRDGNKGIKVSGHALSLREGPKGAKGAMEGKVTRAE
ncbi:MAG TPA: hypothetical protein DCR97_09675 [Deltaproteobacteria bacterium]|nr:hypothetical protein [Deltaproteobacteria bacterium]